ncbi:hypothetical protein DFH09DRAFT_1081602 [Mycena vulgaris]|nr:hypothetical protein DFH09DRAFT_1081602 [Mycena vulgaris]
MAEPTIFHDQYSDPEYSEPNSGDSDFDPKDPPALDVDNSDEDEDVDSDTEIPDTTNSIPTVVASEVKKILLLIAGLGLSLPSVLDAISWGDRGCTLDATIRRARIDLLNSPLLPDILRR